MPPHISQFFCAVSEQIRIPNHILKGKGQEQPRFLLYKTPEGISGAKWSTFKMRQGKPGWPGHTIFVLGKWDTVHNVCQSLHVFLSIFSSITWFKRSKALWRKEHILFLKISINIWSPLSICDYHSAGAFMSVLA